MTISVPFEVHVLREEPGKRILFFPMFTHWRVCTYLRDDETGEVSEAHAEDRSDEFVQSSHDYFSCLWEDYSIQHMGDEA